MREETRASEPFKAVWHFDLESAGRLRVHDTVSVQGGFCPQTTVEERALIASLNFKGAIESPLTGTGTPIGSAEGTYTIAQSKAYLPSVTSLRVRCDCTTVIPPVNAARYLYLRVMELPFTSRSNPDFDMARVTMVRNESRSVEGYQYYNFQTGFPTPSDLSTDHLTVIIPTSGLLAILAPNGDMLKPRPTWGSTWIQANFGGGQWVAIFDSESSASNALIYRLKLEERALITWQFIGEAATIDKADFMGKNARFLPITFGARSLFRITINRIPIDGETISNGADVRTWRDTISDATIEIQTAATLNESSANFAAHFTLHPFLDVGKIQEDAFKFLFVEKGFGQETPPLVASSAWATITTVNRSNESNWIPNENAVQVGNDIGRDAGVPSFTGAKWVAIPLNASFEKTITMPAFEHPFVVQAFFNSPIYADLLGSDASTADVTLQVDPA
jgi:hypothetical protein